MFNNLVNLHDFVVLFEKVRERGVSRILQKLARSDEGRIAHAWAHVDNVPKHWWDIPAVEQRWNHLITGSSSVEPSAYVASKYFAQHDQRSMISLGCGNGGRELRWFATGSLRHIDAYDISPDRIAYAHAQAAKAGLADRIVYRVANVFDLRIPDGTYDVVLLEGALHHFSPLRNIVCAVKRWAAKDGYIIVNDYVGPSRFQWSDRQLEVVNGVLALIPPKYRRMLPDGRLKAKVYRPGRFSMYLSDPSEAAESASILPLLHDVFDVVEQKEYGGAILPLLFRNIAHNFLDGTNETARLLRMLFDIEDELLRCKEVESQFMFFVCRNRDERPASFLRDGSSSV